MGKTTGFIDYTRKTSTDVPPLERIENFIPCSEGGLFEEIAAGQEAD